MAEKPCCNGVSPVADYYCSSCCSCWLNKLLDEQQSHADDGDRHGEKTAPSQTSCDRTHPLSPTLDLQTHELSMLQGTTINVVPTQRPRDVFGNTPPNLSKTYRSIFYPSPTIIQSAVASGRTLESLSLGRCSSQTVSSPVIEIPAFTRFHVAGRSNGQSLRY